MKSMFLILAALVGLAFGALGGVLTMCCTPAGQMRVAELDSPDRGSETWYLMTADSIGYVYRDDFGQPYVKVRMGQKDFHIYLWEETK